MVQQSKLTRSLSGLGALLLLAGLTVQVFLPGKVSAATQITSRKLTLEAGATDGGSKPGGTVKHLFNFTLNDTTDNLGSITFQYCTTAAAVASGIGCVAPAGINVSGASLTQDLGATGFTTLTTSSQDDASDGIVNTITVGRASSTNLVSATATTKEFSGIVNPTTANQTFFVRISTYTSLDGSGTANDVGTVAASTTNLIQLSGTMPESLVFCTGGTISTTAGVPDCSTATSGSVSFNQLFSPTSTAYATSQMAASTNATSGYAITANGTTMTSGANTISAMSTTDTSKFGISQFGMNLVLNDGTAYANAPNIPSSANISQPSNGTNLNAEALAGFSTAGSFTFTGGTPNVVADSTNTGTDAQIYTASYIVNVPGSLPAGTYTTTLTYICTPTF